MHHFSYISHTYVLQNNLQKDAFNLLESNNRKVIPSTEVDSFKAKIIADIKALEQKNNRCKPLNAEWSIWDREDKDFTLYFGTGTICHFSLYAAVN